MQDLGLLSLSTYAQTAISGIGITSLVVSSIKLLAKKPTESLSTPSIIKSAVKCVMEAEGDLVQRHTKGHVLQTPLLSSSEPSATDRFVIPLLRLEHATFSTKKDLYSEYFGSNLIDELNLTTQEIDEQVINCIGETNFNSKIKEESRKIFDFASAVIGYLPLANTTQRGSALAVLSTPKLLNILPNSIADKIRDELYKIDTKEIAVLPLTLQMLIKSNLVLEISEKISKKTKRLAIGEDAISLDVQLELEALFQDLHTHAEYLESKVFKYSAALEDIEKRHIVSAIVATEASVFKSHIYAALYGTYAQCSINNPSNLEIAINDTEVSEVLSMHFAEWKTNTKLLLQPIITSNFQSQLLETLPTYLDGTSDTLRKLDAIYQTQAFEALNTIKNCRTITPGSSYFECRVLDTSAEITESGVSVVRVSPENCIVLNSEIINRKLQLPETLHEFSTEIKRKPRLANCT